MTIRGHVQNGSIVLDEQIALPEGAEVSINVLDASGATPAEAIGPTLFDQFQDMIGTVQGLPADFAANHDHYIHGAPKR